MLLKIGRITSKERGVPDNAEFYSTRGDTLIAMMLEKADVENIAHLAAIAAKANQCPIVAIGPGLIMDPVKCRQWILQGFAEYRSAIPRDQDPAFIDAFSTKPLDGGSILLPGE